MPMTDTIEKRVEDLEQIPAHLPQDLDARFAGADARAGARFDRLNIQLQALKTQVQQSETTLDNRIARIEAKLDEVLNRLPQQ
jgi:hypothetical protein